jgi:WD40 repeat protein
MLHRRCHDRRKDWCGKRGISVMAQSVSDPRIFLSYSRLDAAYAAAQRARIEAEQLALWQDVSHMQGGQWWEQIRSTLEAPATQHMVLFVSPTSLASGVVLDEWRLARRHGVTVHPVKVPGTLTGEHFNAMPRCMSDEHFYDLAIPEQFNLLIANLKGDSRQNNVPMLAPAPDEHFVLRMEEGDRLKQALLRQRSNSDSDSASDNPRSNSPQGDSASKTVGITAALRGAGGYGKTQLARWLSHDEQIVDRFCDGILWVELGEQPQMQEKVEYLIRQLRRELTDADRGFPDARAAAKRLMELLEKGGTQSMGRYLLVIDDAWRKSDVELFQGGAPNTVRLVTTRLDDTLPLNADKIPVDAMKPAEAVELLTVGLVRSDMDRPTREAIKADIDANRNALTALAARLGEWALLLALANGQLRNEVENGATLAEAIAFVARIYDQMGLTAFDPENETSRTRAASLSIETSLKNLKGEEVARFDQLAIFAEDEHIPARTITRMWEKSAGLSETAGEQLLRKLKKFALLMSYDRASGAVRLHDVMRKFLRDKVGEAGLKVLNKDWLAAYERLDGSQLDGPEQLYYYRRRPMHLHDAFELDRLRDLLLDPKWMQDKLAALGAPQPLIEDYRAFAPYDPANKTAAALVGRALTLSAGPLARDLDAQLAEGGSVIRARQLVPHLLGRLRADMLGAAGAPDVEAVLERARRALRPPALVPRVPRLTQADSALLMTLEGHRSGVTAVAFSPDGSRLVSGSHDHTLRLWDARTGAAIGEPMKGHKGLVNAVAFSPDGTRIVSGSSDNTLRLWDAATGAALCEPLEGHSSNVNAVAFSPDGSRLVSGSHDHTLRLWDAHTGAPLGKPLEGHEYQVLAVAFSPDGRRLASGSHNTSTLRLWDAHTAAPLGEPLQYKGGLFGTVYALDFSPDGRRLVSVHGETLRLWDADTGVPLGEPLRGHGHGSWVKAVAFSPDGSRIVSASSDKTLRLWDAATGAALGEPLRGHGDSVNAVAFSPDGTRIVSGSSDKTLRLWDAHAGAVPGAPLEGHEKEVNAVAFSPDGYHLVSVSNEPELRLWDTRTGMPLDEPLGDRQGYSTAVAFSPDGTRLVLGNGAITILDAHTGAQLGRRLEGHRAEVTALAFSPDGSRLVSGSRDHTVRLWDTHTWAELCAPLEHLRGGEEVLAVAFSPDGRRIASGSRERSLRLWDAATGAALMKPLERHRGALSAVAFSPDGRWIVSGSWDDTLRLWDAHTGATIGEPLRGHGEGVTAVVFFPDGRWIASGSEDKTLRLWQACTGVEIARFESEASISCLALSRDGRTLAAGDVVGRVHFFDVLWDAADKQAWLAGFEKDETDTASPAVAAEPSASDTASSASAAASPVPAPAPSPATAPSPEQWYLARASKRYGPLTAAKLGELHAAGQLLPTDLVWRPGLTTWVRADQLKWKGKA